MDLTRGFSYIRNRRHSGKAIGNKEKESSGSRGGVHGSDHGVTKIMIDRAIKFRCRATGGGKARGRRR